MTATQPTTMSSSVRFSSSRKVERSTGAGSTMGEYTVATFSRATPRVIRYSRT
ncbi:hypothetical protein D3C86_2231500 [compost metagenome]